MKGENKMDKDINTSHIRAVQYFFVDGLAEISGAAICMLLAVYFLILQILPASQGGFALIFLFVFIAAFVIRKLMYWYRERSTYPRTGFVEPKKRDDRKLLGIEIGFTVILMGFMLYTILRGIQNMAWIPALCGIIFAFIFALVGYRTKLVRFYFLAVFCLVLGVLLALSGIGDYWAATILCFITGLVMLSFGIVTRAIYLHQPIVSMEQTDER
jgi:hypothetical protein